MSSRHELLKERLSRIPKKDLLELAKVTSIVERRIGNAGPSTDDELHAYIKNVLGIDIPRVSVCEGHCSPFDFIAAIYFCRTQSGIALANRGGSKTFGMAIIHYLNGKFKPGIEGFTFGATEAQSKRAYSHLKKLINRVGDDEIASSLESITTWRNGSTLEIVAGSIKAVNGPHPVVVHADEIDLMDEEVFGESRNMAQSKVTEDVTYPSQNVLTSTRKYAYGLMQRIISEITEDELAGRTPSYDIFTWCCFECAKQIKNCAVACPDLPAEEQCPCASIVKGKWENGEDRTLKSVCKGRFHQSRGWMPFGDIIKYFKENTVSMWEAQQQCLRPSTEGLVLPGFTREHHGLKGFLPDPANGPIYEGIDFGGTNPHAVEFLQHLQHDIQVETWAGGTRTIKQGSVVFFSELYKADISNEKLGDLIAQRESLLVSHIKGFRVKGRFADPQGKAARIALREHNPPLPSIWMGATREVKEQIKIVSDMIESDRFFIDITKCPMLVDEIEAWHYPKKRSNLTDDPEKPVEDFDHACSAMRYALINIHSLAKSARKTSGPTSSTSTHRTKNLLKETVASMPTSVPGTSPFSATPQGERWRSFGMEDM